MRGSVGEMKNTSGIKSADVANRGPAATGGITFAMLV
jgi:hypothetical protein